MRRPGVSALLGVLGSLGLCSGAGAQEKPSASAVAQALFEQARDDMKRGEYPAACPKLEESQRLDPSNGTLLNLVLCEEATGKVASAWLHVHDLADRLPPDDDRRPIAERKLVALSSRVPRLAVRLESAAPAGTRVLLDDIELRPSSLGVPIPIDPGSHKLVVEAPGRPELSAQVTIAEAQQLEWTAQAAPPEMASGVPASSPPVVPSRAPDASHLPRWVPWTTLGVGVAALVTGGVLAALTLDRRATVLRDCPQKQCSDSSALATAADGQRLLVGTFVALGVGAAGTGLGAYLVSRSSANATASPASASAPAGLVVTYALDF
jgi:hypothetical protein